MSITEKSPQFAPFAETLLGTRAFYDDERTKALHEGTLTFTAESAGMRGLMYVRTLRLMAQAVRESDYLENPRRALRPSQLGKFALEHMNEILDIARPLAILNNAERALHEQEALEGLHVHQHPYLHDIIGFLNKPPTRVRMQTHEELIEAYIQGATVEAPTGIGKTVLIARTLAALGVGKPLENLEHDKTRVRALIIVPSQDLVQQMTGKVGDDTLRRFAPGIEVGGYYQHEKNPHADAVVITIDQFIEEFKDGMLHGQRFDVCIIDEAHHATSPQFKRALLQHWRGGPILGFTASPQYSPGKDVRDILTHRIFHGEITDFIESEHDILNAAQLFMIRANYDLYLRGELLKEAKGMRPREVDQLVIREAMTEWLEPLIAQGRRGMIFCEPGGGEPSRYARLMAEKLSGLTRPDGSPLRVAVAGSINKGRSVHRSDSNAGIRRRYREGDLDFIVTVDWGREGLNEEVDVVGVAGQVTSHLKFLQEIGRGTRLSEDFPITVYGHVFVPSKKRQAQSLFGVFGLENIEQGQGIIIGKPSGSGRARPDGDDTRIPIEAFPERIQQIIASMQTKTVAEALFDHEAVTIIPNGHKEFSLIMRDVPGPPVSIRRYLRDTLGYACVGRYEIRDGKRDFYFYFEEAAEEYLNQYRGCVARVDLQRLFGDVDVSIVDALATECKVRPFDWMDKHGHFIPHYKKADAEKITSLFHKTPPATPTDYTSERLAKEANLSRQALLGRLTRTERGLARPRRTTTANGKIRVLDHWNQADAQLIIERMKNMNEAAGNIPVYLVPEKLATSYVKTQRKSLINFADAIGDPTELVQIARGGRPPRCLTWSALEAAEAHFGRRPGTFTIHYEKLPKNFAETRDEAKKNYAIEVLRLLDSLPSENAKKNR